MKGQYHPSAALLSESKLRPHATEIWLRIADIMDVFKRKIILTSGGIRTPRRSAPWSSLHCATLPATHQPINQETLLVVRITPVTLVEL